VSMPDRRREPALTGSLKNKSHERRLPYLSRRVSERCRFGISRWIGQPAAGKQHGPMPAMIENSAHDASDAPGYDLAVLMRSTEHFQQRIAARCKADELSWFMLVIIAGGAVMRLYIMTHIF
jgi:hypothetical protein